VTEEQQHGMIAGISHKLIGALPSHLLMVLLINAVYIGALFWLLSQQNASRERVLVPLLEACSKTIPLEALPHGLVPAPAPAKRKATDDQEPSR
jgi:hypothetical protein